MKCKSKCEWILLTEAKNIIGTDFLKKFYVYNGQYRNKIWVRCKSCNTYFIEYCINAVWYFIKADINEISDFIIYQLKG